MQLGLTIPLQRYLRIKTLEYGKPLDRRYCWDLHGITLQGRRSLLAVHCETRYTFVLFDPSPADWSDLTGAFLLGLRQSLLAAGISQERIKAHLDCAGLPEMTKTHGRREVAFLNRAWEDVMALDYGIIGEDADERSIYDKLMRLDERVAKAFVQMSFFDALLFNMDRHEQNYGVLRDVATGEILGMAPLFDHNIALISRGYPRNLTRANDRLIHDFAVLVKERDTGFVLPRLTRDAVRSALALTQMQPPADEALAESPEKFVVDFIMNGYRQIQKLCPELPLQKSVPRHKTHER